MFEAVKDEIRHMSKAQFVIKNDQGYWEKFKYNFLK